MDRVWKILIASIIPVFSGSALGEIVTYQVKFDPYFIGKFQQDNVIVVNDSDVDLNVVAIAYDPITGEELDRQRFAPIPPGRGSWRPLTLTHPEPHASQLVVDVNYDAERINGVPFTVTRILTNHKTEGTVFQVRGVPVLVNGIEH